MLLVLLGDTATPARKCLASSLLKVVFPKYMDHATQHHRKGSLTSAKQVNPKVQSAKVSISHCSRLSLDNKLISSSVHQRFRDIRQDAD